MKKLLFIIALFVSFTACVPAAEVVKNEVKTEVVATVKGAVDSTLKDSLAMAQIGTIVEEAITDAPDKKAGFWAWFMFIFGVAYGIIGIVASHTKTKKNLWYLRLIPIIVKFIVTYFIVPENKDKDGGVHSI